MITTEQWLLKEIQLWQKQLNETQDEATRFAVKEILWLRRHWLALVQTNQKEKTS